MGRSTAAHAERWAPGVDCRAASAAWRLRGLVNMRLPYGFCQVERLEWAFTADLALTTGDLND